MKQSDFKLSFFSAAFTTSSGSSLSGLQVGVDQISFLFFFIFHFPASYLCLKKFSRGRKYLQDFNEESSLGWSKYFLT